MAIEECAGEILLRVKLSNTNIFLWEKRQYLRWTLRITFLLHKGKKPGQYGAMEADGDRS